MQKSNKPVIKQSKRVSFSPKPEVSQLKSVKVVNNPPVPIFRLDRDEYHVGDCVFVRMDDEEDDLWVAELESLWEDKYKEKWFEGRWFYSALNARAHSNYGQGRNGNNRNWTDAISRHELYESDHVDENTIDCVEGKAKVITQQEFQTYMIRA